jgi:hypothetical protein
MVFENLIGALPLWLGITLFLSYVTWSKYLNRGKLKPDEKLYPQPIDAIIVIFVIFLLILFVAWYFSTSIFFIRVVNDLSGLTKLREFYLSIENIEGFIIIIDALFILPLLASRINIEEKKENLEQTFNYIFLFFLSFFWFLIGSVTYFYIIGSDHYRLIYQNMIIISFMLPFFIIFLNLSKLVEFKFFLDKKRGFSIIIFLIVGFFVSFFSTPIFSYSDANQKYIIGDDFRTYGTAKLDIKREFQLEKGGRFLKITYLDLSGLNMDRDEKLYFSFNVTDKSGKPKLKKEEIYLSQREKKVYPNLGILDYQYIKNSTLRLKIDKDKMENRTRDIYVRGLSQEDKNISQNFKILYSQMVCKNNNCSQNISFINNLDYPVVKDDRDSRVTLLNERLFDKDCILTGVSEIQPKKEHYVDFDKAPQGESYRYYIYHSSSRIGGSNFDLSINGYRLRILNAYGFKIQNNTRVDLTFHYTCK